MSASQQNSGIRKGRQEVGLVPSSDRQETRVLAVSHGLWIGATSCFAQADEDAHNLSPVVEGMNARRQCLQHFNPSTIRAARHVEICSRPARPTSVFSCGLSAVLPVWEAMAQSTRVDDQHGRLCRLPLL